MKEKIKFGIVGCGRIASRHAQHIMNSGELLAVCDIDQSSADELALTHGAKAYYDIGTLLMSEKEIDVISVCTPNGLHAEHSISALQAGFHVLCEKPMAISTYDCGRMIQASEKANKRLFIVKQNRFNPPVAKVKQLIDQGTLGKLYSIQLNCFWNRNNDYYKDSKWKGIGSLDGGTLYTQFSHFIDLLFWMIGDIRKVYSIVENFKHKNIIEFEDSGVTVLKFYNDVIGTINFTINSYSQNMEGSLTIIGEKGTVKIGGQYLNELEYQDIEGLEIKDLPEGNPPNNYGQYLGSMSNHDKVYENLINVLQNGGVMATNAFEGFKTVEIIEKIYKSARKSNCEISE